MLMGYMRISKADGTQALDLQLDALIVAGIDSSKLKHRARATTTSVWIGA
jgi:hypothetical protein